MEKDKILYKLNCLEKKIIRTIIKDISITGNYDKISFPTPTQMQIIGFTINSSKDVYQKDLESVLNLRRATVSGVLQTMEKNNLIMREVSDNDARSRKIILKDKARLIYNENKERLDNLENIIKKGISDQDLFVFSKVVDKIKNNLDEYNSDGGKY